MIRWLLGAVLGLAGLVALLGAGAYFALKRADIAYETLAHDYESAASRYVDLPGGVHMHYRDEGGSEAPVLVLVHGYSASLQTWEPWVERLATGENRIGDYRIITLDLPGHGLTRAPAGYQPSIEAFRDAVAEFVQAEGLDHFALGGNSMGGNVAWEYALAHPDHVTALILVDSAGWPDTRVDASQEPLVFKLLRNPITAPILRDVDATQLVRQGLVAAFPMHPDLVNDAMVKRYTDLARAPGHRDMLVELMLDRTRRNYATPERLAALSVPTLILEGDHDALVPPEHAQQFKDAIPNAQLVMFEGVGHAPQEEIPDQSASVVNDFLNRVVQGRR
jgi:pimeloyl-ACP methyl ester carboxylesterase